MISEWRQVLEKDKWSNKKSAQHSYPNAFGHLVFFPECCVLLPNVHMLRSAIMPHY